MSSVIPDPAATDWVPLGGVGVQGAMVPIQEFLLGADGPIDFTNIPQTFAHLRLLASLRTANATEFEQLNIRFNGDATVGNYGGQLGAFAAGTASGAAASVNLGNCVANSAVAGARSALALDIPDYSNTSLFKPYQSRLSLHGGTTIASYFADSRYNQVAAISRIELRGNTQANFKAGSRATLYGILPPGVTYMPTALRVVSGVVAGNGSIVQGVGFSVVRTGVGRYTVTFSTPFAAIPSVVASLNQLFSQVVQTISVSNVTTTGFDVQATNNTTGTSGSFTDFPFAFHAIGT